MAAPGNVGSLLPYLREPEAPYVALRKKWNKFSAVKKRTVKKRTDLIAFGNRRLWRV